MFRNKVKSSLVTEVTGRDYYIGDLGDDDRIPCDSASTHWKKVFLSTKRFQASVRYLFVFEVTHAAYIFCMPGMELLDCTPALVWPVLMWTVYGLTVRTVSQFLTVNSIDDAGPPPTYIQPVYCCTQLLNTPLTRCLCGCAYAPWSLTQIHRYSSIHSFIKNNVSFYFYLFSEQRLILFALVTPTMFQLSLCWVTHGCCPLKKPSAWIYIPTLWSIMSPPDWPHNGEEWRL